MKSVTSIEAKIALAQEKLLAAEARYNAWAEKLLALQEEKEEVQAANIAAGICQDTSKKLVRSLFTPEEPQQGLCPYASLPQDIF